MIDKKPSLLIGTRNIGKIKEFEKLLNLPMVDIHYLSEFPKISDIDETGSTFQANALLKAKYIAGKTGLPTISDDSGLQIKMLNNFPGIYSARCAGKDATDDDKVKFILEKSKNLIDRSALFICVICYYNPINNHTATFSGVCNGKLLKEPIGIAKKNLQYDRIFFSNDGNNVFSQMSEEEKGLVSHRGKAIKKVREYLKKIYGIECG
jgi:XTP/dITP diphosphohydrolase